MPSITTDLRDLIYAKLLLKQLATEFVINDFEIERTYLPYSELSRARVDNPSGKVYLVTGVPGDIVNTSRKNRGIARDISIILGYQICDVKVTDYGTLDDYVFLVEQLDEMCREEIDPSTVYSFSRLEYLKDENGVPYSFLGLRDNKTFESYFTATFNFTLQ
jgi:hypothetical protein